MHSAFGATPTWVDTSCPSVDEHGSSQTLQPYGCWQPVGASPAPAWPLEAQGKVWILVPDGQGAATWLLQCGACLVPVVIGAEGGAHAPAGQKCEDRGAAARQPGCATPTICGSVGDLDEHGLAAGAGPLCEPQAVAEHGRGGRTALLRRQRLRRAKARALAASEPQGAAASREEDVELEAELAAREGACLAAAGRPRGAVLRLSFEPGPQGCWAVQAALLQVNGAEAADLVSELHGHVREAMESPHANYVIQKVVETLPTSLSGFVAMELRGTGVDAARHKFGCRIVCRLIEHTAISAETAALLDEILVEAGKLSRHTFGHHVVQSVLEHGWPRHRRMVLDALRGDLPRCSRNRNSSYVVEKALTHCKDDRAAMARELLASYDDVLQLAQCQFGHNVVRTLAGLPGGCDGCAEAVLGVVRGAAAALGESKYGRRLLEDLGLEAVP